ncbi:MAG: isocitrate lyase/PEP mutase family protein [Dehalococcoidia bacterium]
MKSDQMVVAPFCFDAIHAKIAQRVGFECIYMTGMGTAAARGYPDLGLLTESEMVQNARYVANAVDMPVVADADTGYGNPINVRRTVRDYEDAGVAGIHIEDQVFPKRCGFFEGKEVVPTEDHVQRVRAAVDARRDADFVIIARVDSLAVTGWDDTILRAHAYRQAGADMVFVDGIRTLDDLQTYARVLDGVPRLYNGMLLPASRIQELGFKLMIAGGTLRVISHAVTAAFQELRTAGTMTFDPFGDHEVSFVELMGTSDALEMARQYGAHKTDVSSTRIEGSSVVDQSSGV